MNESTYLARNIAQLRSSRGMNQTQLAKASGLPRSTITHLETGSANPSLSTLLALAVALKVNPEVLISRPKKSLEHIPAAQIPLIEKAGGRAKIHKLLPDKIRGMHIDLMELNPGSQFSGHPHLRGTKEYLYVIEGSFTVFVDGESSELKQGDLLAFEGDQPHGYKNQGGKKSWAISVVVPALG